MSLATPSEGEERPRPVAAPRPRLACSGLRVLPPRARPARRRLTVRRPRPRAETLNRVPAAELDGPPGPIPEEAQSKRPSLPLRARSLFMSSKEKPTLGGTRIKTRKRNIAAPLDPASFSDAIVQIYLDNGGDLFDSYQA